MYLLGTEQIGKLIKDLGSCLYSNDFNVNYECVNGGNESVELVINNIITINLYLTNENYFDFNLKIDTEAKYYEVFKNEILQHVGTKENLFFDTELNVVKENNEFKFVTHNELSREMTIDNMCDDNVDDVLHVFDLVLDFPVVAEIIYDFIKNCKMNMDGYTKKKMQQYVVEV